MVYVAMYWYNNNNWLKINKSLFSHCEICHAHVFICHFHTVKITLNMIFSQCENNSLERKTGI